MTPQLDTLAPPIPAPAAPPAVPAIPAPAAPVGEETRRRRARPAPGPDDGRSWQAAHLGSLAYTLFAVQQPGPLAELRTREEVLAAGVAPHTPAAGVETDHFLRRQNVLGEISLLDL